MLDIKKIWRDTYLVNGEHLTQDYNQAVIIANKGKKIRNFEVDYMETTFWKKLKNKLNFPFLLLESWM
ncbi:hypothetical protein ABVN55_00525 [Fusobacterium animalis]|jgi:hypothetical protein|uniref:hypothetical protein n=1 Tax=Fusobacterium TaxID=848 RepID=UPI0003B8A290|nr:hypothetical protein [Fusobacterium nucleatum]ERT39765.1 hypothetical protein HMPREF1766_00124 [Fusobacterium nucleatum CTI-5]